MPVANELDIELPSIFIFRALSNPDPAWPASGGWRAQDWAEVQTASAAIVAECGKRLWSEPGVPNNPAFPYIMWSGRTDRNNSTAFHLPREFTARKSALYTVRRFDKWESGVGSFNAARATYNNLKKCLCGVGETPITSGGQVIGRIVDAVWHDDHRATYRDADSGALFTELGIVVALTYENN